MLWPCGRGRVEGRLERCIRVQHVGPDRRAHERLAICCWNDELVRIVCIVSLKAHALLRRQIVARAFGTLLFGESMQRDDSLMMQ